jgi:multiple sugar transport system substrate-binding protein
LKRRVLARAAVVSLVLVQILTSAAGIMAADKFNWRKYEGTTIRFMANVHPWTKSVTPLIPEFEKKTGIKVVLESFAEEQFRQKLSIELAARKGLVDVFMLQPSQDARQYSMYKWVEPLGKYIANTKSTNSDFDCGDFTESGLRGETIGKNLIGLPIQQSVHLLTYRKDLFDKYNIKVPTTFEELEKAAAKLTMDTDGDGKTDVYGIVNRGRGAAAVHSVSSFLHGMGGNWLDQKRRPVFDSEAGVKAFKLYGDLIRKYGPPGSINYSWQEEVTMMTQGQAAMCTDSNTFVAMYEDAAKCKYAGKFGYAMFPAGPKGSVPTTFLWGLSMASDSKKKPAAWLFMQYILSKEAMLESTRCGVPTARKSCWKDKSITDQFGKMPGLLDTIEKSLKIANSEPQPMVVAVPEVRDALGRAVTAAIEGKDVAAALKTAAKEVANIIKTTEVKK